MTKKELTSLNQSLLSENKKYCTGCNTIKSILDYNKSKQFKSGIAHRCKDCTNLYNRKYEKGPGKEKCLERAKKRYRKHRKKYRNWELIREFGITLDDYNNILLEQNNVCYICKNPELNRKTKTLSVDHCHKSGNVRGLLCSNCNLGLGNFQDNIEYLKTAIEYLLKNK